MHDDGPQPEERTLPNESRKASSVGYGCILDSCIVPSAGGQVAMPSGSRDHTERASERAPCQREASDALKRAGRGLDMAPLRPLLMLSSLLYSHEIARQLGYDAHGPPSLSRCAMRTADPPSWITQRRPESYVKYQPIEAAVAPRALVGRQSPLFMAALSSSRLVVAWARRRRHAP